MTVNYLPADTSGWLVLAAGDAVLLYPGGDGALNDTLWDAIRSGDPVQACLEALTRRGLTSAPPFAMASWSGVAGSDAVILARGAASATVITAAETTRVDGSSVSTWLEQRVKGVSAVVLGEKVPGSVTLPLDSGAAFASWVQLGVSSAATPRSEPAPVAAPLRGEPSVADPRTIGSLPESTITDVTEVAPVAEVTPGSGYAHLFEETIVRNIEDAAVRPPDDVEESDAAESGDSDEAIETASGDHDGLTVMSGDIADLRRSRASADVVAPRAARPTLAWFLELSTGGREPLVHTVLVGRSPSVSKISSGQVPRLVTIPGDKDISRNHAQLSLEGGTVVVTDLHSRNGTSIILPGKSPQSLRAGEPTPVIPGTVVDLGGGVRLTVIEETS